MNTKMTDKSREEIGVLMSYFRSNGANDIRGAALLNADLLIVILEKLEEISKKLDKLK